MAVGSLQAAARIKTQLITLGTIAARGHAQLLLARLSSLAPITAQRGHSTHSNQHHLSVPALVRAQHRRTMPPVKTARTVPPAP
jgi:hypothetical protein